MNATSQKKYQPTEKAQKFLDKVENPKYDRGMIRGLNKFIGLVLVFMFKSNWPTDLSSCSGLEVCPSSPLYL